MSNEGSSTLYRFTVRVEINSPEKHFLAGVFPEFLDNDMAETISCFRLNHLLDYDKYKAKYGYIKSDIDFLDVFDLGIVKGYIEFHDDTYNHAERLAKLIKKILKEVGAIPLSGILYLHSDPDIVSNIIDFFATINMPATGINVILSSMSPGKVRS